METQTTGAVQLRPWLEAIAAIATALNRPVSLTWEVNTVGPYGTLLKWMRSEGFRRQRPKYLVWTMLELDAELLPDRQDIWGQAAIKPAALVAEVNRLLG